MAQDGGGDARLLSVCVGRPQLLEWRGRRVESAIAKRPVTGPVALARDNLEGDAQADLTVHGGPWKAVYLYPSEHYGPWRGELEDSELPHGSFGENLTSAGLDEERVSIGDVLRIGSAELQVTQPRLPCFKLVARFRRDDMAKRMLASGRTGFYLAVRREGRVEAGDAVERIEADPRGVSVAALVGLYTRKTGDPELLERVLSVPALPDWWRAELRERGSAGLA